MFFRKNTTKKKERVYLDYASASPVSQNVLSVMIETEEMCFANASGLHKEALLSADSLQSSRETVSRFFSCHTDECIFTSGGTESDVLAIRGVVEEVLSQEEFKKKKPHVVMSAIEHSAVRETVLSLAQKKKITFSVIPVDEDGLIAIESLKDHIKEETVLVSIMYVNNEIGAVQDIVAIAKEIRRIKKKFSGSRYRQYPLFHTDASQALLTEMVSMPKLGVDILSCNGGKIYGPKGVGLLVVKRGIPISPVFYSGATGSIRPGTAPVGLIAGFARAIEDIEIDSDNIREHLSLLRDYFLTQADLVLKDTDLVDLGLSYVVHGKEGRVASHIASISVRGLEGEHVVIELDAKGVAVSSRSACQTQGEESSHVLSAIGFEEGVYGTVRFSFGRETSLDDISYGIGALAEVCKKLLHTKKQYGL